MLKDKLLLGVTVGILADVFKISANYIAFLLGFTQVVFWQIAATRFLEKGDLFNPLAYLIGGIADLTVSALIGIIFTYFIFVSGKENLWIKGVGFGLVIWVGLFGTLLGQSVQDKLPQAPASIMTTIVAHFIFGLGLAFFTRLFYRVGNKNKRKEGSGIYRFVPLPAKKCSYSNSKNKDNSYKKVKLKKPIKL